MTDPLVARYLTAQNEVKRRDALAALAAAIRSIARRVLATERLTPEDREDLIAEVAFRLLQHLSERIERLEEYTAAVTYRLLARHIRSERQRRARETAYVDDVQHLAAPPRTVDYLALQQVLEQLTPSERQVIAWYLEGRSAAEIAHDLQITAGAVAVRLSRLRNQLRQSLHVEL